MAPTRDPRLPLPGWLPDLVVAVAVVCAAFAPSPDPLMRPAGMVAPVLVLLPLLILPFRRRWPRAVLALLLVVFAVTTLHGTLSPGVGISLGVAMYAVALRTTRLRGFVTGALVAVAAAGCAMLASSGQVLDPRALLFGLAVALGTALGDASRSRREYIEAIREQARRDVLAREAEGRRRLTEERLRIARDLHDAVAHQIAVVSLNAGVASSSLDRRPEKAREALATVREAARGVLGEIGELMTMLRADEDPAVPEAPQPGLGELPALLQRFREAGLAVTVRAEGAALAAEGTAGELTAGELPGAQALAALPSMTAFRVIQEGLTNAHKHGAQGRAHLLVTASDEELSVVLTNPMLTREAADGGPGGGPSGGPGGGPGTGPDGGPGTGPGGGTGLGLAGLRERVAAARGTLRVGVVAGTWRLAVTLPLASASTRKVAVAL